MSEDGELFRQMRDAQQKRRAERLPGRQQEIESLADSGYKVKKFTDYHYRINDVYDLYPVHNNWYNIKTGKRGSVKNLKAFILQNLSPISS